MMGNEGEMQVCLGGGLVSNAGVNGGLGSREAGEIERESEKASSPKE